MHRLLLAVALLPSLARAQEPPLAIPVDAVPADLPVPASGPAALGFTGVEPAPGFLGSTLGASELTYDEVRQVAAEVGFVSVTPEEDDGAMPLLEIGGELREGRCFVRPGGNACELAVRWRVRDVRADRVLYEVVSRGFVVDPSGSRTTGRKAVLLAVRDLLGRDGFRALVAGDRPGATVTDAESPGRLDAWLAANPMDGDSKGRKR